MNQGQAALESEAQAISERAREAAADLDRCLRDTEGSLPEKTKSLAEELTTALKTDAVGALLPERLQTLADCLNQDDPQDRPILEVIRRLQPLLPRARQVREATGAA
jgi:hypothetical protein